MIPSIRKSVFVPVSPHAAFVRFTREIASWWPVDTHSVLGDRLKTLVFEERVGGRVYELGHEGEEQEWGDVLVWQEDRRVAFTFMKYRDEGVTEVDVRFTPVTGGTWVDLEHRGWEAFTEADRDGYDSGWDHVFVEGFGNVEAVP